MRALVIGGGSFGTALAQLLADAGQDTHWWMRETEIRADVRETGCNNSHHPGIRLPSQIVVEDELGPALERAELVINAIPSQVVRAAWTEWASHLAPGAILVMASKGIEEETCATMEQVIEQTLGPEVAARTAVVSGPSFAREVLERHPTAVVVAARDPEVATTVQHALSTAYFRAYSTDDVLGAELGGAVKNVMAIAAGILDGLGFGHNARAALITRGMAEIRRLGETMGAAPETIAGLAGVGDLILTCTGDLSRNRNVGLRIGRGETLEQILASMSEVAEGVRTTRSVHDLSRRVEVEMPIVDQVFQILYEDKNPKIAIAELMGRSLKAETD